MLPIGPNLKVENCILGVLCYFDEKLPQTFSLGLKMVIIQYGRVEVYPVKVFQSRRILDHARAAGDSIHPPWLTSNVSSVQHSVAITFNQEHDSPYAVVGIK